VSKPKKSVVTTEDFRSPGDTEKILGCRVLSRGSCAALNRKSERAVARCFFLGGALA